MSTFYVTKYALTEGIQAIQTDEPRDGWNAISWKGNFGDWKWSHGEGKEWHRTRKEAEERAEAMRLAKIASLKKQITKLEKMEFTL